VVVDGQKFSVQVGPAGEIAAINPTSTSAQSAPAVQPSSGGASITAPLAGNIVRVNVRVGDRVAQGDVVLILEAMKMETEIRAAQDGIVLSIDVSAGDSVAIGSTLMALS
jgi:oxaloacetate decarboxylase alpha subunit